MSEQWVCNAYGEWCDACRVGMPRVIMFGDDIELTNSFALNWKMSLYRNFILISLGHVQVSQHIGLAHSSSESQLAIAMGPWIWSYPCSLTSSDLSLSYFNHCWWLWSVTVWAGHKVSNKTSALAVHVRNPGLSMVCFARPICLDWQQSQHITFWN